MSTTNEAGPITGPASKSVASPTKDNSNRPTVADLLADSLQARRYSNQRLVECFRKSGTDRWGLWFDYKLSIPPEELEPDDVLWISETWKQFVAGDKPFARRRVSL